MSMYSLEPDIPPQRPTPALALAVAILFFMLLGAALMWWAVENNLVLAPTPTPTATPGEPLIPTPDFRATQVAEDLATQEAVSTALHGTPLALALVLAQDGATPVQPPAEQGEPPPEPSVVVLPAVSAEEPAATATPPPAEAASPLATPTPASLAATIGLPLVSNPPPLTPTPVPTPIPVAPEASPTPTPAVPVEQPTATPTPGAPSPTPETPPAPPTPTTTGAAVVSVLNALVGGSGGAVRVSPASFFTATGQLAANAQVELRGRTPSGEWVYVCCVDNASGWMRQIDAPPRGNETDDAPPPGYDPNDRTWINNVRWLPEQAPPGNLLPPPLPTAVSAADYPLFRHDRANQGRVQNLSANFINREPAIRYPAGGSFISPVVIAGDSVLAGHSDSHLYSVSRVAGNQRWRIQLAGKVQFSPSIRESQVFVGDDTRTVYALEDQGNSARVVWQQQLPYRIAGPINIAYDYILVPTTEESHTFLYRFNRSDGGGRLEFNLDGPQPQFPAVGDQLVYATGGRNLWAVDLFNFDNVWSYAAAQVLSAPPLYSANGVRAQAELYAGDSGGGLYALDANRGVELWLQNTGAAVTALAADADQLYVVTGTQLQARARFDGSQRWSQPINETIIGGPIVGPGYVVIFTASGSAGFYRTSGDFAGSVRIPTALAGQGALAGDWLYLSGSDGVLYGFTAQ